MNTWNHEVQTDQHDNLPARYAPKDITNTRDITLELQRIDATPALSALEKYRHKRQLMRAVFSAKQREINHHLDSYENYLLARKDVESRSIALEAQKAIMQLEQDQLEMMKQIGLTHSNEVGTTLLQAGHMLTAKIREIEGADLLPEIKQQTLANVRHVWDRTNNRILESVDTYMDELYRKERTRVR